MTRHPSHSPDDLVGSHGRPGATSRMDRLVDGLRSACGVDVSRLSEGFLEKVLSWQAEAAGASGPEAWLDRMESDPAWAARMADALNISSSEFFRCPLTFAHLEQRLLPAVVGEAVRNGREIRVWVAGCAAGQEAWSLAILLEELTAGRGLRVGYRVLATDRSAPVIEAAMSGVYESKMLGNVRLRHLEKYFHQVRPDAYSICDKLRKRVDFFTADLLDGIPPGPGEQFDIISCCNVLFYYRIEPVREILSLFRRELLDGGVLITGYAEKRLVAPNTGFRSCSREMGIFHRGPGSRNA